MANEINLSFNPDKTIYVTIRKQSGGDVWNVATSAWVSWGADGSGIDDYDIQLTDRSGGLYQGDFPSSISRGWYVQHGFLQIGGSPAGAPTDPLVGTDNVYWNGSSIITDSTPATSARTRAQIKTLVRSHTGRTKDTLESSLCDTAIKVALMRHLFKDAQSMPSDFAITEDATSIDISSISGLANVTTARIVEVSGSRNETLKLKTKSWWDLNVINPEDNQKGWPAYGLRWESTIVIDRPSESGLALRLRVVKTLTFTSEATICPIALLDIFVEHYVTAMVFKSLENDEMYKHWIVSAMGLRYLVDGTVGGALADAIAADEDSALDIKAEPYDRPSEHAAGVSVRNLITGHGDYGNTRWWN